MHRFPIKNPNTNYIPVRVATGIPQQVSEQVIKSLRVFLATIERLKITKRIRGPWRVYMLVTKPRNLHYRYCPLQYWYGLQY